MPTPASRPASSSAPGTERTRVPLCDIPLHDAEGTEIRWRCRVEQVAVDKAGGAYPDRLNQQGDGNQTPIPLRPHLVRVLDAPDASRSR